MWYDNLGPVLEPYLRSLSEALDATPLAFWALRADGLHFLLESTEEGSFDLKGADGIGFGPRGLAFETDAFSGEVEIIDSEARPHLALTLESVYPDAVHPPHFLKREVPLESDLFRCLKLAGPTVRKIQFPEDSDSIPDFLRGEEGWVGRLDRGGRPLGLIGLHVSWRAEPPSNFEEVWASQGGAWRELQMRASLARRTETLRAARAIGDTITSQLEIHDILQSVVEQATVLMKSKIASLMLVEEDPSELVLESVYGSTPDYVNKPNLDIDRSLLGRVVRTGRPLIVLDVRKCEAYANRDLAEKEGMVSLLSVPLKWKETSLGVLNVYSARRYRYTRDDAYLLSMLASQAAIALHNARAVARSNQLENQIHELDKLSVVGELAAGVAHEIRNPLAAVRMLIDTWEASDENQRQDLEVISTQLRGINKCVTQLLESAQPEIPNFTAVDLGKEVAGALQILRVRLRDQEIRTRLDIPDNLPPIYADASRFRQLLMNLSLNALNAMPRRGEITIEARVGKEEDFDAAPGTPIVPWEAMGGEAECVLFSFLDTGGGLEEEHLRDIFEPFHTHTQGGFGLGLSVVKRIVQEARASLKAENRPGEGLGYRVLFRVADGEAKIKG